MAHYNEWNEFGEYVPATHPAAPSITPSLDRDLSINELVGALTAPTIQGQDIPEEYRRIVEKPTGNVQGWVGTYNPFNVGRTVSRGVDSDDTPSAPATYITPSKKEVILKDGQQRVTDPHPTPFGDSTSIYTWIDGEWHYQGEANDPNLIGKEQFIKNYYEQKATAEQQTASNAVVAAVPPSAGYTPPATDWSNILNIGSRWNPLWGSGGLWTSAPQVGDNAYMDELANTYLRMAGQ
jgi:hypothetical protein